MENIFDQEILPTEDDSLDDDEVEAKRENKLYDSFKHLQDAVKCLVDCGFDIDNNNINVDFLKNLGSVGYILTEDSKIRVRASYGEFSGLKILLEEKSKNPINHDFYELRKLEINEKFEDARLGYLL